MKNYKTKVKSYLKYTLLPILLYGVLGPLEIYAGNTDEFLFILKDFFWFFLTVSFFLWIASSAVLALLPEKIENVLCTAIFIFSILSYVQNLFLNRHIMNWNGSPMNWDSMHSTMIKNLIVWIFLSAILIGVPFVFRKYYKKIYEFITLFIAAVQIVTIIYLFASTVTVSYDSMMLSAKGQLEVAPNNNVIVLILDSCYNTLFEETMDEHPEVVETLKDFTYYDNADCHYNYTFPSIPHMLTGTEFDCDIASQEWKMACWHEDRSENFYNTLRSLNYECDLYSSNIIYAQVGPIENLKDIFDNVTERDIQVNHRVLFVEMAKMSIYKYVPYIFKPTFEVTDHMTQYMAGYTGDKIPYGNGEFYQSLLDEGIVINETLDNKFSVIHLRGAHGPCYTNADGTDSETETSISETSDGLAVIIEEYIRQLKGLGGDIYDNATVIITADHGTDRFSPQPIYFIKPPHTVQDEMQITSAPVSHDDFQATVLTCIGQDSTGYGTSVFDWQDGDQRTREYWYPADFIYNDGRGFYIFRYDSDRYELMEMPLEEAEYRFSRYYP